jgi:PhzF family phenazine biosynthesis protein
MRLPFFHVDAFTSRPFAGNPAAVCLLDAPAEPDWMRQVAAELNLSETAFVAPIDGGFGLRWFTPQVEVDLCGHATLASAHVLWESGRLPRETPARFHTRSGWLTAAFQDGWITLDFPTLPIAPGPVPAEAVSAAGVEPVWTGTCGARWVIEAASEDAVCALRPDFGRLRALKGRALMVTAAAAPGAGYDFVTRYFAPWVGVDEDPVTGSAHCALGPFWAARLGRAPLTAYQASARGGRLRVEPSGDRVQLSGQAVTVVAGDMLGGAGIHRPATA